MYNIAKLNMHTPGPDEMHLVLSPEEVAEYIRDYHDAAKNIGLDMIEDIDVDHMNCISYPLKTGLEHAREMKKIEDNYGNMNALVEELGFNADNPVVRELIETHCETDYERGVSEGELCVDYYGQRLSDLYEGRFRGMNRNGLRIYEVADGNVGKILWRMVKAWMLTKSVSDFWRKVTAEGRHAPGGFAEIATSAFASGDERLEMCAKRALQHDVLARIVRDRLGADAFREIEAAVEERVEELLA